MADYRALRLDLLFLLLLLLLLLVVLRALPLLLLLLLLLLLPAAFLLLRPPVPPLFLAGTLAPARRASDRPMAIACLRLFTVLPVLPLFSSPRLRSCIAGFTLVDAFFPYLAMRILLSRWAAAKSPACS